jgi:hypothetical protein
MLAGDVIADVRNLLRGKPVFLAGSLVAEEAYGMSDAHSDVDLFCPTDQVLIAVGQFLLDQGYKFDDRFERTWERWLSMGFNKWHTNSLRLLSPAGVETNLVYKLTDGHPTTSLAQVIESFDFGLLAEGYDLKTDTYRDMRSYLFPGMDPLGPLPLMPNKRSNWRNGFISQYNGLREVGRYAKYATYGYDLSLVKDDLVTGYDMAYLYMSNHFDADKQLLGQIYAAIRDHIKADNIPEMLKAAAVLNYKDSLDVIMAALE